MLENLFIITPESDRGKIQKNWKNYGIQKIRIGVEKYEKIIYFRLRKCKILEIGTFDLEIGNFLEKIRKLKFLKNFLIE